MDNSIEKLENTIEKLQKRGLKGRKKKKRDGLKKVPMLNFKKYGLK